MLSDNEFRILLDQLDRPWAGYRKVRKGVKKRLRRHMLALGCVAIAPYLDRLARDPRIKAACLPGQTAGRSRGGGVPVSAVRSRSISIIFPRAICLFQSAVLLSARTFGVSLPDRAALTRRIFAPQAAISSP